MLNSNYYFSTKKTLDLSDDELLECLNLYNSNYGNYSDSSSFHPGEAVHFSERLYKNYQRKYFYVATARYNGELVAHAFYIRKHYEPYGKMTWVLQLVVHRNHRKRGIAGRLLHSIWGFSDDYAWGLASANPCTVKTLESATCRDCDPSIILNEMDAVRAICRDTSFITDDSFEVDNHTSIVNTKFFVDNSDYETVPYVEGNLGVLKPGYEWLAMTFQNQLMVKEKFMKHFEDMLAFSESKLKEAYSRMDMNNHAWAQKTIDEIDYVSEFLCPGSVLDMGCGHGRHSLELAKRGFNVTGIDFIDEHIIDANSKLSELGLNNVTFRVEDLRQWHSNEQFDNIICLYDVVGSFPEDEENIAIIQNASDCIRSGGILVLSVMNMELTESLVDDDHKLSIRNNPEALFKLKASSNMQNSGNVFEGDSILIDTDSDIVYRKEQFDNNDVLSAEYVIRDKRYRMSEIIELLEKHGFSIIENKYTHLGFKDFYTATDKHAKEILIVAKKTS